SSSGLSTANDTVPSSLTSFGFPPSIFDLASATRPRRSTLSPGTTPSIVTRQRSPTHLTDAIFAASATPVPGLTSIRGTTSSCTERPPSSHSFPAFNQPTPGGDATETSGFQCQPTTGKSVLAVPFIAARRPQPLSTMNFGKSLFSRAPGISNQPWSVTTRSSF